MTAVAEPTMPTFDMPIPSLAPAVPAHEHEAKPHDIPIIC